METSRIDADTVLEDLEAVRRRAPLVHNITNYVVMNVSANMLLAVGASPVMAHALEEVRELVGLANALVINIGTLSTRWVEAMHVALAAASARRLTTVLDPVGVGATAFRRETAEALLAAGPPTIVRGNASELVALSAGDATMRGVDSSAPAEAALPAARAVARRTGGVACVSGADDHVVDATGRWCTLSNGHPWMTRVTGMGCSASALVGAFAAVQPDAFRATVSAMAALGVAGEIAGEQAEARGLGALESELISALHRLDGATLRSRLRVRSST